MTVALVRIASVTGAINGGTSAPVDTTGGTLGVMFTSSHASTPSTISDSAGNIWTLEATAHDTAGINITVSLFAAADFISSATHTFTAAGSGLAISAEIQVFGGVRAASPLSSVTTDGSLPPDVSPGTITPPANGYLLVTGVGDNCSPAPTRTITAGFTITHQQAFASGVNEGVAMAYLIQGAAAPATPVWTISGAPQSNAFSILAAFIPIAPPPAGGGQSFMSSPLFDRE
jgi:hypothetical protein